jgi:shikimate kinase
VKGESSALPTSVLIVISGPIASGKSTVARVLARQIERSGRRVAVIDLDLVHETVIRSPGTATDRDLAWSLARQAAATIANTLMDQGVGVVIAEGSFNDLSKRSDFVGRLRPGVVPIYVTLLVSYEEALRRAQRDPTRGVSRDPSFLRRYYDQVNRELAGLPESDMVIDTELLTEEAAASIIGERLPDGRSA